MNNKNHLSYFLNSMKDELDFSDAEDFKDKVHLKENLGFRIKIQKLFRKGIMDSRNKQKNKKI